MSTATAIAPDDVGLDPTGIRRLTAAVARREKLNREVIEAVTRELDLLRKRRYRAAETMAQHDREIANLNRWLERQEGEEQCR